MDSQIRDHAVDMDDDVKCEDVRERVRGVYRLYVV